MTSENQMLVKAQKTMSDGAYRLLKRVGSEWPQGSRLPSIRNLAREMGIANATAHRAVRELSDKGLLVTRPGSGVFVSDRAIVKALSEQAVPESAKSRKGALASRKVALLRGQVAGEDLVDRMIAGFHRELQPMGCVQTELLYADVTGNPTSTLSKFDAVVLFNPSAAAPVPSVGQALLIVATGCAYRPPRTQGYDVVSVEHEQGGMIAGQTLREAGARRVCFIGKSGTSKDLKSATGPLDETSQRRLNGLLQGFGGDSKDIDVIYTASYGQLSGALAFRQFVALSPRPDAVFGASDEIALGFMVGAAAMGLMPGQDYLLIGFDGQRVGQEVAFVPLTTVEVPAHEMGRRAAHLLAERLTDPTLQVRRVSLGCGLLPGASATWHPTRKTSKS